MVVRPVNLIFFALCVNYEELFGLNKLKNKERKDHQKGATKKLEKAKPVPLTLKQVIFQILELVPTRIPLAVNLGLKM